MILKEEKKTFSSVTLRTFLALCATFPLLCFQFETYNFPRISIPLLQRDISLFQWDSRSTVIESSWKWSMKTGAFTYPVNRVRCIKMKDGITVFKPILLHTQHFSIFFFRNSSQCCQTHLKVALKLICCRFTKWIMWCQAYYHQQFLFFPSSPFRSSSS